MTPGLPKADPNGPPPGRIRGGRTHGGALLLSVVIARVQPFALAR